MRFLAGFS
jgi:MFS family permease